MSRELHFRVMDKWHLLPVARPIRAVDSWGRFFPVIQQESGLVRLMLRVRSLCGATLAGFGRTYRPQLIRLWPQAKDRPNRKPRPTR